MVVGNPTTFSKQQATSTIKELNMYPKTLLDIQKLNNEIFDLKFIILKSGDTDPMKYALLAELDKQMKFGLHLLETYDREFDRVYRNGLHELRGRFKATKNIWGDVV